MWKLSRWRHKTGLGLILLGSILLVITSLGQWTDTGGYSNSLPRRGELFDPDLAGKTPDLKTLYKAAEDRAPGKLSELPPDVVMEILYRTVAERFTHGNQAQHTLFSNWLLWGLGQVQPSFVYIRDPDTLLKQGHSALCSQVSYVLLCLAERAGIQPRHVGLNGHVVMEAWYMNDWHLYDPDLEVVAKDSTGSVLSVETLSQNADLVRQVYTGRGDHAFIEKIVAIITSREDNTYMTYPVGSQFEWKSQVLMKLEQGAQILKFIIPVLIILIGSGLLRVGRRNSVGSSGGKKGVS
ncbi:hypothetical protein [Desulfolucanica intricata]|uniref:hypothetical protein n=1 Tax=Desulfolucanica intricata TaxID=1285191 RepID=UPI000834A58D|nr:hypothetical protein [Desulfolucanica intricata]